MKCSNEDIQMLLDDYLSGDLGPEDKLLVKKHLAGCEDCRDFKEHLEWTSRCVKQYAAQEAEKHISAETLQTYADNPKMLDREVAELVEIHLLVCRHCQGWYEDLVAFNEEVMGEQPRYEFWPVRASRRFRGGKWVLEKIYPVAAAVLLAIAYVAISQFGVVAEIADLIEGPPRIELVAEAMERSELILPDLPLAGPQEPVNFSDSKSAALAVMRVMLEDSNFDFDSISVTVPHWSLFDIRSPLLRFQDSSNVTIAEFQGVATRYAGDKPSRWQAWILILPASDLYAIDLRRDTCTVTWPYESGRKGIIVITNKTGETYLPSLGTKFSFE